MCTDAILLARDDAKSHKSFAEIFLKNEKPIYIDKPIALSVSDLDDLYKISRYSDQIFSWCLRLRMVVSYSRRVGSIGDLVEGKWSNTKIMGKIRCSSDRSAGPFMEFEKNDKVD